MDMTFTLDSQSMAEQFRTWRISNFSPMRVASVWEPSGYWGALDIRLPEYERATRDEEFEEQKAAFKNIPSECFEPYRGRFVATRNGEIVDSDDDLTALTRRFFREHGDVPVYITRVGEPMHVTLRTPRFR